MEKIDLKVYEMKADVFKALGNPIRLMIIDFLKENEKCVCEICEFIGSSYANISKHLSFMKKVGLIDNRKDGNNIYYFIKMPCALNFNECVTKVVKNQINQYQKLINKF